MRIVRSYSPRLKAYALQLRKQGRTYQEIIEKLDLQPPLAKNTLSCWCMNAGMVFTPVVTEKMRATRMQNLRAAQAKGAKRNHEKKLERLKEAADAARAFLQSFKRETTHDLLFLSGLYLGEGTKNNETVSFANTNVSIIQAFLTVFRRSFPLNPKKFSVKLLLRYDQDPDQLRNFWSIITRIPVEQFQKANHDIRTAGKATYATYKGVCTLYYYDARIQRILLELQNQYIEHIMTTKS